MAVVLQQNMGGGVEALTLLMETAMERRADLVLMQEPPEFEESDIQDSTFYEQRGY